MADVLDASQLALLERRIDEWLAELRAEHDHLVAVDRDESDARRGLVRWYVRMRGEDKEFTTVWLTLGQRTLRYETYVMPAPEENAAELADQLLRRNDTLVGAHFSIGAEDAVYLRGETDSVHVTKHTVDDLLGLLYAQVEQCFLALLRIGYPRFFAGDSPA
ncbi:MAG: YbjN domain-containing protein [Actinomycetota bacterium]